jgi:hypothetical protein
MCKGYERCLSGQVSSEGTVRFVPFMCKPLEQETKPPGINAPACFLNLGNVSRVSPSNVRLIHIFCASTRQLTRGSL